MATPYRLKRSSVTGKRPALADLEKGELGLNFYDGHLFAERDTGGVGIATTIANLTPWKEHFGGGTIEYTGVVTAPTYHGDQVIGTPNGGFKSGAFTISADNVTKDSINELNYILGKLVPTSPDTIAGAAVTVTSLVCTGSNCETVGLLCNTSGSWVQDHTSTGIATAGQSYLRNTDNTLDTKYLFQYGPGDNGTVTAYINTVNVGTIGLTTAANNGTYNSSGSSAAAGLQIANNVDASNSARNPGIDSGFYYTYDARVVGAASSNGFNEVYFTHGGNTSGKAYYYEDNSTVIAPVISFSAVTPPASGVTTHSSNIPHYKNDNANAFTYVATVTNATGNMYKQNRLLKSETNSQYVAAGGSGNAFAFSNPGHKDYDDFAAGTLPPARNYGVGSGVTCLISQVPQNVHATAMNNVNHFTRWDADTPYGQHTDQRLNYDKNVNIMGSTAVTDGSPIDEDSIYSDVGSDSGGAAKRVNAGATGDTPTPVYTSWVSNATLAVYEATVRGGVLRHDVTDYSAAVWLPTGPDLSSGRSGNQYFQVEVIESAVSEFNIEVAGTYAGCWVCMPQNSTWTSGLNNTNGWADMFNEYAGSGNPNNADNGCASGGVMTGSSGTFKCVFGEQSSSNDTANRILIRFKLTSGQSITTLRFEDT